MGMAPSWSCDPDAANKLSFPLPKEAPHKIWPLIGQAVLEKKIFEHCGRTDRRKGGRTTDGQMPDHEYPISSPMSLRLRAKNKVSDQLHTYYCTADLCLCFRICHQKQTLGFRDFHLCLLHRH